MGGLYARIRAAPSWPTVVFVLLTAVAFAVVGQCIVQWSAFCYVPPYYAVCTTIGWAVIAGACCRLHSYAAKHAPDTRVVSPRHNSC